MHGIKEKYLRVIRIIPRVIVHEKNLKYLRSSLFDIALFDILMQIKIEYVSIEEILLQ